MERLTQARSLMGCKRFFLIAGCLLIVATALFAAQPAWRSRLHSPPLLSAWSRQQPARQPPPPEQPPSPQEAAPVQRPPPPQQPPRPGSPSCRGARGQLINDETTQDLPTFRTALPVPGISINDPADYVYPEPTYGSYRALGLEKTWMTFRQRYEAYGYGETEGAYPLAHVSWETVDWGQLQQDCLLSQPENLTEEVPAQANWPPRFRLAKNPESPERAEQPTRPKRPHAHHPNHPHPPRPPESPETPEPPGEKGLRQLVALPEEGSPKPGNGKRKIGRQAIILRTWSTYRYTQEDLWNVRSIITEASLANQGRYTVFLLVDVKREDGARIHTDDAFYRQVLEESVPKEFWGLAVLFHESLQRSWYPKIREYHPYWQIMQPFQLFSRFYPEFDHLWQIEMDTRFLGHTGKMLNAYQAFGKKEPYKQARERASWTFMPRVHGNYRKFSNGINRALQSNATTWGPPDTRIPGFKPLGPTPPVADATLDHFEWLKGEEADLLLLAPAFDPARVQTQPDWLFKNWIMGFDRSLPRLASFPAQARASRELLAAAHIGQRDLGLRLAGEATLPSFALWHGFKIVQPPIPKFTFPERDLHELNEIYNGGMPTAFHDGIARGKDPYRANALRWYSRPRTWEWGSSLVEPVWMHWRNWGPKKKRAWADVFGPVPNELPAFLRRIDGEVYAPNLMLHPHKTNGKPVGGG